MVRKPRCVVEKKLFASYTENWGTAGAYDKEVPIILICERRIGHEGVHRAKCQGAVIRW